MSDFIPKPDCTRADGACFREGECLADCNGATESLVRGTEVRGYQREVEALRARVVELEERLEWQAAVNSALLPYQERAVTAEAQVAALRAGIEGLASKLERPVTMSQFRNVADMASHMHHEMLTVADELRALLGGGEVDRG